MMNKVFSYCKDIGVFYGVENTSILLYAIVKMQRPCFVLELGSGSASLSLMIAQALKENGLGKITSIDNGSQWQSISKIKKLNNYIDDVGNNYFEFLNKLSWSFGVSEYINFVESNFPDFPTVDSPIDILFCDYESHPLAIEQILKHFMPLMSSNFSIFIDGVSNYLPSFLFLERLIDQINSGKLPNSFISPENPHSEIWWKSFIMTHKLKVVHLTEKIERTQNATAWIIGEPVDYRPYPKIKML